MKIHLLRSHRKKKLIQLLSPNRTKNPTFLHQVSPPLVYFPGSWSSSLVYLSPSPSQSKLANQMGDTFRRVGKPMRLRDVLVTGGQNIWSSLAKVNYLVLDEADLLLEGKTQESRYTSNRSYMQ
jgi:hypothetical protein